MAKSCPVCNASMATKAALRTHMSKKHVAVFQRMYAQPAPQPLKKTKTRGSRGGAASRGNSGSTRVLSGTDLLNLMTIPLKMKVGTAIAILEINPLKMDISRLAAEAKLWSRWRPKKFVVSLKSSASNMVVGMYTMGWAPGPVIKRQGTDLIRCIATMKPHDTKHIFENGSLVIPPKTSQTWYFCSGQEAEDTNHGVVYVVLAAPISAMTGIGGIGVRIEISWTIEFDGPVLELETGATGGFLQADPNWCPIFTDSVSDWADGVKLTFKHTEGGSAVPWHDAEPGVVYEPGKGVTIPYYKADGKSAEAKAFVRAKIYDSYPILACFATKADAQAYIKDGNHSHILDYVKAGDWVTPQVPYLTTGFSASPLGGALYTNISTANVKTGGLSEDVASLQEQVQRLSLQLGGLMAQLALSPAGASSGYINPGLCPNKNANSNEELRDCEGTCLCAGACNCSLLGSDISIVGDSGN